MERLIVLPPVKDRVRTALLGLADYEDIPTDELKQMARQLLLRLSRIAQQDDIVRMVRALGGQGSAVGRPVKIVDMLGWEIRDLMPR